MTQTTLPQSVSIRQHEIMTDYLRELDKHLCAVEQGNVEEMYDIKDFAEILHIHPRHLSNTIKHATGRSPCDIFEYRLIDVAKKLLTETRLPIAEIATRMTYDPSNFTKFFKRYVGATPKQFRETRHQESQKTEPLTI